MLGSFAKFRNAAMSFVMSVCPSVCPFVRMEQPGSYWMDIHGIWWYDMIYLLTAIGLSPGDRSTVHIYTQTIHRTIKNKQYIEQDNKQTIHRTTQQNLSVFRKSVKKIQISLKYDNKNYMKINISVWTYLAQFCLYWKMFQTNVVEKIGKHILISITSFFFENRAVYEIMWKNRPQWQ